MGYNVSMLCSHITSGMQVKNDIVPLDTLSVQLLSKKSIKGALISCFMQKSPVNRLELGTFTLLIPIGLRFWKLKART